MPVILIDGVSTSGKSIALKKIQRQYSETIPNYAKLIITEHFTERYFQDKNISKEAVENHIKSILNSVIAFKTLQKHSAFVRNEKILTVYIERLLLSFYSRKIIDKDTFDHLAGQFSIVQCTHYLLTIPVEKFEKRLVSSLEHRNKLWSDYIINQLGGIAKAVFHFQKQQEAMLEGSQILSKYMSTEVITVDDIEGDFYKKMQ